VARLLRPQLPPHVRVELQLPDAPCHVRADPTELHQVIVNIASNGLHAMATMGTTLTFALSQDESSVHLVISDDGVGMLPEVLDRAIEPFFTTRDVGDGTGLGLAVVHGVITSLGGTLKLRSVPGSGTTVSVTLPRAAATTDGAPETPPVAAGAAGTSLRVLLVDDDPQVRHAIARLLERAGHRVESFAAAPPALEALQADGARADVILTDLTMPLMNGLELTERLRQLPAMPPVVLISGYLDLATSQRARSLGIAALLDKPVTAEDLARVLAEVSQARAR
jgi:CheY-like chemotaxis protein